MSFSAKIVASNNSIIKLRYFSETTTMQVTTEEIIYPSSDGQPMADSTI
ncbi:hypothetical protein QUB19_16465 [Microcoleus sp. B4-C5]